MMKTRSITLIFGLALLAQALLGSRANAQTGVIVYRLEILSEQGVNHHPYSGGYFVAPLLGGTGSFLLTSTADGRTFTQADDSGKLFTAVNGKSKKAVISAKTGTGTASGSLVAIGKIDHQLEVDGPLVTLQVRVADSLAGTAVSADDESTATVPAADGSIGSAGVSKLVFLLDKGQTNFANKHGLSLSQTVAAVALELQRRGYSKETTTTTTTTSGTGTGTGS